MNNILKSLQWTPLKSTHKMGMWNLINVPNPPISKQLQSYMSRMSSLYLIDKNFHDKKSTPCDTTWGYKYDSHYGPDQVQVNTYYIADPGEEQT